MPPRKRRGEAMASIEKYFEYQERRLRDDFETIRATYRDSDVKSSANEDVVAQFLRKHVSARYLVTNVEIIDSYGQASNEVDVCACNTDQPFYESPGQIVIAEGVDFVVQVKASLTSREVDRIIDNCDSVKKLCRKAWDKDQVIATLADVPYFVERIPYIALAFSSQLKLDTVLRKLIEKLSNVALERQPDAIFILNKGGIYNFREGKGRTWKSGDKPILGLAAVYPGERTLFEFIRYIYTIVPRFHRVASPLLHYFPDRPGYRLIGRTE